MGEKMIYYYYMRCDIFIKKLGKSSLT